MAHAPAHWIIYPSRENIAVLGQGNQYAEGRFSSREIAGPVDGIDNPVESLSHAPDQASVDLAGFLTHNARIRQDRCQAFAQPCFAFLVGNRAKLARPFFHDLIVREVEDSWHANISPHLTPTSTSD